MLLYPDGAQSRSLCPKAIAPPSDKTRHLGLAAANGAVYAFGGWSMGAAMGEGATTDRVERYDPATNVRDFLALQSSTWHLPQPSSNPTLAGGGIQP